MRIMDKIVKLIDVKSIVTLIFAVAFTILSAKGAISF